MKIALISCSKNKLKGIHKACDLYNSQLFNFQKKYAIKNFDDYYILSAKYGLLKKNDIIKSYNLTLNNFNQKQLKLWAYRVFLEIEKKISLKNEFYFLCGIKYRKYLIKKIKDNFNIPRSYSLCKQLKFYKNNL